MFTSPVHPYTKALAGAFPRIGDRTYRGNPTGLAGDPPDPEDIPSGCAFHPRCAEAFGPCPTTIPILARSHDGRASACLLVEGAGAGATTSEEVSS